MPRRHRRAPEEGPQPLRMPQSVAPMWALVPGFDVRRVSSDKPYRCPGCELEIRLAVWHLVVVPQDAPDERRHWHEGCWRVELNRTRGRRRDV
ncbi:MAG: ATP/GTP-binding protein [Actinomycetota bacterium]